MRIVRRLWEKKSVKVNQSLHRDSGSWDRGRRECPSHARR